MSYSAYQKTQQTAESPRDTEYRLFGNVTASLTEAKSCRPTDPKIIKALDWNRRMWSTFSADCGAPGNQLPKELRASIISLSIWVSKHSSKVMRGEASIDPLININKTVMEGLRASASAPAKPAEQSASPLTGGRPLTAQLTI